MLRDGEYPFSENPKTHKQEHHTPHVVKHVKMRNNMTCTCTIHSIQCGGLGMSMYDHDGNSWVRGDIIEGWDTGRRQSEPRMIVVSRECTYDQSKINRNTRFVEEE